MGIVDKSRSGVEEQIDFERHQKNTSCITRHSLSFLYRSSSYSPPVD